MRSLTNQDDATKYFDRQKGALFGIRDTDGFQEIKDYWYRVYDDACVAVQTTDAKDVSKVAFYQAQMSNARSFIDRLDNMST